MKELTPQEILAETIAAAEENRDPDFSAYRAPAGAGPAADEDEDEELFTAADLAKLGERSVRYQIPGTRKVVYIHPIGTKDYQLMLNWSLAVELPDPEDPHPAGALRARVANGQVLQTELNLFQVILCCRRGPNRRSKRLFTRKDAPALHELLPFTAVNEIIRISNELTGDESLSVGVRRFFTLVQTCWQTFVSRCNTSDDSLPGSLDILGRFASLASRLSITGVLDSDTRAEAERLAAELASLGAA